MAQGRSTKSIAMIEWTRSSGLSIKISLSLQGRKTMFSRAAFYKLTNKEQKEWETNHIRKLVESEDDEHSWGSRKGGDGDEAGKARMGKGEDGGGVEDAEVRGELPRPPDP